MSKKKREARKNNLADQAVYDAYKDNIPLDQAWTWRIEGLQAPHVRASYKNAGVKKLVTVAVLAVAKLLSIYFSLMILHTDPFKYGEAENGALLKRFSNPGELTELRIDSVVTDIQSNSHTETDENGDQYRVTEYTLTRDETRPIVAVGEYAFNCDERLQVIEIGPGVTEIDNKAFYSCYALCEFRVDPENPNYCDIDGVLFNKDRTELICYPIDRDRYLREKYGYTAQYWPTDKWREKGLDKYNKDYTRTYELQVNTYAVPETVKTIGPLAFNYAELFTVYLPEGLQRLETMALFRNWHLERCDTYTGKLSANGLPVKSSVKASLPASLTFIGSDCFNCDEQLEYLYIPAGVTEIGHHAFWGALKAASPDGVPRIYTERTAEDLKANVVLGDQWRGEYDKGLLPRASEVVSGVGREAYLNR